MPHALCKEPLLHHLFRNGSQRASRRRPCSGHPVDRWTNSSSCSISPDPNIETNEIGVPPVFATRLTYPEPVTSHNFKDMQQAVINGVDHWPGASAIENENGQVINLRMKSQEERISIANQLLAPTAGDLSGLRNKKVYRHLANGDVVLINRQPTLHKPGIMGHRVRVLPGYVVSISALSPGVAKPAPEAHSPSTWSSQDHR